MKVFAVAVLILAILALINLNRIKFWMRGRRDSENIPSVLDTAGQWPGHSWTPDILVY